MPENDLRSKSASKAHSSRPDKVSTVALKRTGRPERADEIPSVSRIESHLWEAANILRGPVAANDFNLNIARYVEPRLEKEVLTVDEAMKRLRVSAEGAFAAEDKLIGILKREGLLK